MAFERPACPAGWLRVIDTAQPPGHDLPAQPAPLHSPESNRHTQLAARSLLLLVAEPLLRGRHLAD